MTLLTPEAVQARLREVADDIGYEENHQALGFSEQRARILAAADLISTLQAQVQQLEQERDALKGFFGDMGPASQRALQRFNEINDLKARAEAVEAERDQLRLAEEGP